MSHIMLEVIAEVNPVDSGFCATVVSPEGIPVLATASSLPEVVSLLEEALRFHAEDLTLFDEVTPELSALHKGDFSLRLRMRLKSLIALLAPAVGKTGLKEITGISDTQFWRYEHEDITPRRKQLQKVETAVHHLGKALQAIDLV